MKFVLTIDCDNDAFRQREMEVARILRVVSGLLREGREDGKTSDLNGNSVGRFGFEE